MKKIKLLKWKMGISFLTVGVGVCMGAGPVILTPGAEADAAAALVERVLPDHADQFAVEMIPPAGEFDVFEFESDSGKVVLRGNNGVSVASALYRYLKDYPKCQLSWNGDQLDLPAQIPSVPQKVRVECLHKHRVYFNYCTLNYTASWWDWERWQREIDFMAMNGINMPLGVIGLEGVWYHTLLKFGFTDLEAREYLVGPTYFAWQWMTNIEAHGGPLPKEWIDQHIVLGNQILDRQRALGMTPIQQGFTGSVPRKMMEKFPDANIIKQGGWCGFEGTAQLDPLDPLFATFGTEFLNTEIELFGTSHIYAADPFHEGAPPQTGEEYLGLVGQAINDLVIGVDPEACTVMQSWSIRKEICEAFPHDRIIVLDLSGRRTNFWGYRYVKGQLHNFGGRINMHGDLAYVAENPFASAAKADPLCVGMGLFPEGLEQNPVFYNMVFDMIWRDQAVDTQTWLEGYAERRYGAETTNTKEAWRLLFEKGPYRRDTNGVELSSIIAARPALIPKKSGPNDGFSIPYEPTLLIDVWRLLLSDYDLLKDSEGYQFDVIDVGRQVLSNLGQEMIPDIEQAFLDGNIPGFNKMTGRFHQLLEDVNALLAPIPTHNFSKWVGDAREFGSTEELKDYYEWNASMLVTIWGPQERPLIFDYSWREWSGLIDLYYLPRWEMFHAHLAGLLENGESYVDPTHLTHGREALRANAFYSSLADWEIAWTKTPHEMVPVSNDDPVVLALAALAKYEPLFAELYVPKGLCAWWTFDDATGDTVADSSNWGVHGTMESAFWDTGNNGGALRFDGNTNGIVTLGTGASLDGLCNLTVSAWVKTTSTASGVIIQQRSDGKYNGEYQLSLNANGTVHFMLYGNKNYQYQFETTQAVNDGAWHFIVAVRDGDDGYIYIDGNPTPAASATEEARPLDATIGVVIGVDALDDSMHFNGWIDDVRIHDVALSPTQIMALQSPHPPVASDASFSVLENAVLDTPVGTVSVSDPDSGDQITFSITAGNDGNVFAINAVSGQISVLGTLDYENKASFDVTVTVFDMSGLTDTATITISVLDVVNDDSDADGMIDEWEVVHFGSSSAQDEIGDPDNDHVINKWEYHFNTDPNDPSDFTALYVGLRAWWKLDDASGDTAVDSSGYEANGTVIGPSWSTSGYRAGALEFDGIDDLVNLGTAASLNGKTDLTLTAWVKTTNTAISVILQQRGDGGFNGEYQLSLNANGTVNFLLYGNGSYQYQFETTQTVNDGAWHFIVAVRDGLDGYIYIDGNSTPAASATGLAIRDLASTIGVALGQDTLDSNKIFNGLIDDVRIYDIALDATAIANLYNSPSSSSRVYLSDINWVSQTTGWGGSVKKDLSIQSNSIILDGTTYPKGLGAHAQSEIVYNLAGNYVSFHSIVGVDDETGSNGSVIFKVYGDDVLLYETAVINAAGTETLNIEVAGVQMLKLVVDTNGSDANDHADWANACVLLDSDGDGLADEWETTHFGNITAQDGVGDPDSDGVSNRQEQTFGTNPMDANDAPSAEYINLRGWWKLDEIAGTVAFDSSGNGLNASNTNGVLVSQSGHVNGAFGFDGTDDFSVTQGTAVPEGDLTITAWIRPSDVQGEQSVLSKEGAFTLKLHNSSLRFTTPGDKNHDGLNLYTANEWQFVAVTFTPSSSDGCRFYRNGAFLNAVSSSAINQNSNSLLLGKNQWGEYFWGRLDEVHLYDRILTASEIDALYQQNAGVYNQWKGTKFTSAELTNPAISGDAADVDADQLSTLVEYALGLDPKTHSGSFAGCAIELDGSNGWKVEFNRHASRNDIDLILEWSDELNPANWQPVAQSIAGGVVQPLNGASLVSETGSEPTVVELNVPSTVPHGFIRWKVERR